MPKKTDQECDAGITAKICGMVHCKSCHQVIKGIVNDSISHAQKCDIRTHTRVLLY